MNQKISNVDARPLPPRSTTRPQLNLEGAKMVLHVFFSDEEKFKRSFSVGANVVVARAPQCHIVLPSHHLSRRHVTLKWTSSGLTIEDTWLGGTLGAQDRLRGRASTHRARRRFLMVGPYRVVVRLTWTQSESPEQRRAVHSRLLDRLDLKNRKLGAVVTPELRREVNEALRLIVEEPGLDIRP